MLTGTHSISVLERQDPRSRRSSGARCEGSERALRARGGDAGDLPSVVATWRRTSSMLRRSSSNQRGASMPMSFDRCSKPKRSNATRRRRNIKATASSPTRSSSGRTIRASSRRSRCKREASNAATRSVPSGSEGEVEGIKPLVASSHAADPTSSSSMRRRPRSRAARHSPPPSFRIARRAPAPPKQRRTNGEPSLRIALAAVA